MAVCAVHPDAAGTSRPSVIPGYRRRGATSPISSATVGFWRTSGSAVWDAGSAMIRAVGLRRIRSGRGALQRERRALQEHRMRMMEITRRLALPIMRAVAPMDAEQMTAHCQFRSRQAGPCKKNAAMFMICVTARAARVRIGVIIPFLSAWRQSVRTITGGSIRTIGAAMLLHGFIMQRCNGMAASHSVTGRKTACRQTRTRNWFSLRISPSLGTGRNKIVHILHMERSDYTYIVRILATWTIGGLLAPLALLELASHRGPHRGPLAAVPVMLAMAFVFAVMCGALLVCRWAVARRIAAWMLGIACSCCIALAIFDVAIT